MRPAWNVLVAAVLLSGAFAALVLPSATAAETRTLDPRLPEPLVGAAAVHLDGATYLFGGRRADGTYSSQIHRFDHATGQVSPAGSFPVTTDAPNPGRYSGTAVALGGRILYFGGATMIEADVNGDGSTESVPKASKEIFEYDPVSRTMRATLDTLPNAVWGATAVAARGKVYVFGGFTFDVFNLPATARHNAIVRYDPAATGTARVQTLGDALPYRVQDAAGALLGGTNARIYLMGGLSDHDANANPCPTYSTVDPETGEQQTHQVEVCLTRSIVSFDPDTELVRGVVGELPYRTQFSYAGVAGGKAYLPGALLSDGTAATSIVEVSVSAGTPTARVITPVLPTGAFGQGVSSDGTVLTVFGGRYGEPSDLLDTILRIDPRPTVPWPPRSATVAPISGGVRVAWEPPAYDGGSVVTSYRVYRSVDGGAETLLKETPLLAHDDLDVQPGTEYTYRVSAVNERGEGEKTGRIGRTTEATVPGRVSGFQAYSGNGEVVLRWLPPADTGGSNVTGYRVYRNDTLLASVGPSAHEYRDTAVHNGVVYSYAVRAYNAKGDGLPTDSVRVSPAPVPPPPSGITVEAQSTPESAVTLTWIPPNDPVTHYVVYRAVTPGEAVPIANVTDATSFTDLRVERGRTYFYSVVSANSVGASPPSEEVAVSLVRKPGAPTGLQAAGLEGEVRLTWQAPEDLGDAPPDAVRYYVTRSGGGSSREIIVKTDIRGTTFADRTVTPGQAYTYTVTTLNPQASDPSGPATATPLAIANKKPEAKLAILPALATAGDPVQLDASQSIDPDGAIREYVFDFGDGTEPVRTQSPSVTHAYASNGTYTAVVVVTDTRNEVSEPARAQVVVGETVTGNAGESGVGGVGSRPGSVPGGVKQPGTETPAIPGPGALAALAALAAVAAALRRRRA